MATTEEVQMVNQTPALAQVQDHTKRLGAALVGATAAARVFAVGMSDLRVSLNRFRRAFGNANRDKPREG